MNADELERLQKLFTEALRLGPNQRAAFLDDRCGEDVELRRAVEELILHSDPGLLRTGALARNASPAGSGRPAPEPPPDRIGPYTIEGTLGAGGMGKVFLGRHVELDRLAAVKVLPGPLHRIESCRERFRQEAQAMARVRHPGVLPIHEVGESEGRPYAALEYVAGGSLEDVLGRLRGRDLASARRIGTALLPGNGSYEDRLVPLFAQIAEALEAIHQARVVHRDIKPSNLLVATSGRVYVADFGIALQEGRDRLTELGVILGTRAYMAPESTMGAAARPESDVYSLGVALYEMLTLRPPFSARSEEVLLREIRERDPESPRSLNPFASKDLSAVCLKALSKRPERRYRSAAEMAADLAAVLQGRSPSAREPSMARRAAGLLWYHRRAAVSWLAVVLLLVSAVVLLRVHGNEVRAAEQEEWSSSFQNAQALLFGDEPGDGSPMVRNRERALDLLVRCTELRPRRKEAWLYRAEAARRLGRREEARRCLLEANKNGAEGWLSTRLQRDLGLAGSGQRLPAFDPEDTRDAWSGWAPIDLLALAKAFLPNPLYREDAFEILMSPSLRGEYAPPRDFLLALTLYNDWADDGQVSLVPGVDRTFRVALDRYDSVLQTIPESSTVQFNRAILVREAIRRGIRLGADRDEAWSSALAYFRREYEARGDEQSRAHLIHALQVDWRQLGREPSFDEAIELLTVTDDRELLGYEVAEYEACLRVLVGGSRFERSLCLLSERPSFEYVPNAQGPAHLVTALLHVELVEDGVREPCPDALSDLLDTWKDQLDERDLEASRQTVADLRIRASQGKR